MDRDFVRDLYLFEWELRSKLTAWLQVPIAALSVLAVGVTVVLQGFSYSLGILTGVFVVAAGGAIAALVCGIAFVVRSFHGYRYEKLPRLSALRHLYLERRWYDARRGGSDAETHAYFEDFLSRRMAEATDRNAENNVRKSQFLHSAGMATMLALVFLGTASIPYTWQRIRDASVPPQVRRAAPMEVRMIERERQAEEEEVPAVPQVSPDDPPEEPGNEEIRENVPLRNGL